MLRWELIKQLSDDFNKQDLPILKWTFVHQYLNPHGKRSRHAPALLKSCLLNWWYSVSYLHLQTEWSKCSFSIRTLVLFQLCICLEGNQVYECSLCQNRSLNPKSWSQPCFYWVSAVKCGKQSDLEELECHSCLISMQSYQSAFQEDTAKRGRSCQPSNRHPSSSTRW
jgi:hypothetical protein